MMDIQFGKDKVKVRFNGGEGQPFVELERPYAEVRAYVQEGESCALTEVPSPKEVMLAGMAAREAVLHAVRTISGGKE